MDSFLIRSSALTPRRRPGGEASASSSDERDGISVNAVIVDSDTDQDEEIAEIPDTASNVYEQNTSSSSTGNQEAGGKASLSSNKQNPWPYLNKFFECIGLKDQKKKTIWNINVCSVNHCVKNYHAV